MEEHIDQVHGTYETYSIHVSNRLGAAPYVSSPGEKRKVTEKIAICQQYATMEPENEPYQPRESDVEMRRRFWYLNMPPTIESLIPDELWRPNFDIRQVQASITGHPL